MFYAKVRYFICLLCKRAFLFEVRLLLFTNEYGNASLINDTCEVMTEYDIINTPNFVCSS